MIIKIECEKDQNALFMGLVEINVLENVRCTNGMFDLSKGTNFNMDKDGKITQTNENNYEPVIHCKNCHFFETDGYLEGFGWCNFHHHAFKEKGFCSEGLREEEHHDHKA